jgi:RND family efflux transporter MFP subunit
MPLKDINVGAQPEETPELLPAQEVTWIGRDRAPITPATAPFDHEQSESPWPPLWGTGRIRWMVGGGAVFLAVIAVLVAIRLGSQFNTTTLASEGAIPLVTAVAPGVTSVTRTVTFTGTINARYDMPIGTEGETGRISGVFVEAGDHVRKGQLLARLDDSVLQPQVSRLAASLDEARANAALADAEYGRARGVEASGALSAEDIEKRRASAVTAAAQVKVAAAQLAEYEARLSHTDIRAPADGVVLTRTAEVGQIATPGGNALFRLARGGEVEMRGQVAEQDLPSLRVGQTALVRLTGLEQPFEGKVRLLGAIIDPQTRLGEIRVALQPDPALRPGAFARAEAVVGSGMRPMLPQTAVLSDEKGSYVLIVNSEGRVERRGVQIADTTADGIVIAAGLTGRERVVTTAAGFLRPGERVTVIEPKAR